MNLKWDHILDGKLLVLMGKGNKSRYVYFPKKIDKLLKEWKEFCFSLGKGDFVISLDNGNKITEGAISSYFQNVSKNIGFKVYPHLLRHTFCSMSIAKGINLYTVQLQMGHSQISTTNRYMHLSNKAVSQEIEQKFNFNY